MSLTNPKNVITEERLAEFYQTILPYLGGMPDLLANKFSKSDLYSTDERIVGQWVDGKPIYQKTEKVTVVGTSSSKSVTYDFRNSIPDMCDLITYKVNIRALQGTSQYDFYLNPNKIVQINNHILSVTDNYGGYNSNPSQPRKILTLSVSDGFNDKEIEFYITSQYTKTTDSPVSVGNDTDYSTTEKIVGTWINGKPIYQKTVDFGTMPNSDYKTVSVSDLNIELCVNIWGIAYKSDGSANPLPFVNANHPSSNQTSDASLAYDGGSKVIGIRTYLNYTNRNAYITLQYTKTTD